MKIQKTFWACILLLAFLCSSCNLSHKQHIYVPEERVVLSASSGDVRLGPDFNFTLLMSETIAKVTIVSDGEVHTRPMWGFDEYPPEKRPQVTYTEYKASVDEVWYGEDTEQEIVLHITGDLNTEVTKPRKNDQLVLFLRCVEGVYYLINCEYSIFAINPGDAMYAFGDEDSFTCYDNNSSFAFKEAIQEKYQHMDSIYEELCVGIGKLPTGPIAESYMNAESSGDT